MSSVAIPAPRVPTLVRAVGSCVLASLLLGASQGASAQSPDIVLHASAASVVHGDWSTRSSGGAADGRSLATPDEGWARTDAPLAGPSNYFELTFDAPAATTYRLWLRLRAKDDSKWNDAVWVQFDDAEFPGGGAAYRTGTTDALLVNLEHCRGCGSNGWGWTNGAYWLSQETRLRFATSGPHRIRIQTREDGVEIDQVVLSPSTYLSSAPGPDGGDTTILPASTDGTSGGGVDTGGSPYGGQPAAVPGTLEATAFDDGGEGIGYHDTSSGNTGGALRATDVDLEASHGGGYNVGWVAPGEWLRYTVDVAAAGVYEVQLRVAAPDGGMTVGVESGESRASASVPATGGWQNWTTVTVPLTLEAGVQAITVRFPSSGLNLRSLTLALAGTTPQGPPGSLTFIVRASENLQHAIDQASPGDTIRLEAGATFVGNFVLPAKDGGSSAYITIRTTTPDDDLPAPGTRMTPAYASRLPRLRSPNNEPVFRAAPGAHHYRLQFLELAANADVNGTILALGDGSRAQDRLELVPHHLEVDRVYLHGDPSSGHKRGIALNGAATTVRDSWISDIKQDDQESQAMAGWNGPGPFTIENNYLEAAGEIVMFGGADPAIPGLVPSDIVLRRNVFTRPVSWRGRWQVKNLLELKNAQRVTIDANVFENNWEDAQQGYAILMKSNNQDGTAPWSVVQDVQFTNNLVRHVSSAVNILGRVPGQDAVELNGITIRNNVFDDVSGDRWGGAGRFLVINGGYDIVVDHNTVLNDGVVTVVPDSSAVRQVHFTNNLLFDNGYAVKGAGTTEGTATFDRFFPAAEVLGNLMVGAPADLYPTGNFYPGSAASVGFVDAAGGDYRLSSQSPYRGGGTDGGDPGCDIAALLAALAGVLP
ncbi:MAG: carbohydrate-binding protein [Vicinamibacterales bacterium]